MRITKKIKFEDKNSNTIKANSVYIITNSEVNEIKHVVNSLISLAELNVFDFNETTRYLSVKLPDPIMDSDSKNFYVEIGIADNKEFIGEKKKDSKYGDGFFILKNGRYEAFSSISASRAGENILIDFSDLTEDEKKKYFIRYRFFSSELIVNNGIYNYNEYTYPIGSKIGAFGISPDIADLPDVVNRKIRKQ